MKQLIKGYIDSCTLVKKRITELTAMKNEMKKHGDLAGISELDLERRIRLLYCEHGEMMNIVCHLSDYSRRLEQRAES